MLQRGRQQLPVSVAKSVEPFLEPPLEVSQNRLGTIGFVLVPAHDVHHQRGNQRARKQVGGEHGEHHRLRQRHEQIARYAGQEEHRHEHNADAQGGNEGRDRDLLRAVQNGLFQLLALGQVAFDVFDFDRGVVHQDADRQRQPSQGHDVDRLAQRAQRQHGDEDRKRDGDGNNDGGAPVAEK